jgi:cytochrome P450
MFLRICVIPSSYNLEVNTLSRTIVGGVDHDDLDTFWRRSDDMVMPVGNQNPSLYQVRGYLESHRDFATYLTAKIAELQQVPADDMVSDVANAEIDGDRLELQEQLSIISHLLTAGDETATKLITALALYLTERPDLQDRVRTDRSTIPLWSKRYSVSKHLLADYSVERCRTLP